MINAKDEVGWVMSCLKQPQRVVGNELIGFSGHSFQYPYDTIHFTALGI